MTIKVIIPPKKTSVKTFIKATEGNKTQNCVIFRTIAVFATEYPSSMNAGYNTLTDDERRYIRYVIYPSSKASEGITGSCPAFNNKCDGSNGYPAWIFLL